MESRIPSLASGTRLGPYEIAAEIGAGGMGEVYRATDTRLGRPVAIKVLSRDLLSRGELRERFDREARTISNLNHPHICTLHDVGNQDGLDYLVMEFLEGETLAARLERGHLPLKEALRMALQIGDALDKAHRQGVIHRDLKPGNVMLTKNGAKLLDFGLAKLLPEAQGPVSVSAMPTDAKNMTVAGTILGTLQYMSPEQLEGKPADARSDIFAFGATLYEMITGQKAFQGKTQVSLIAAILEHDPPPMSSLQPILPLMLDRVVQDCLVKDPEERCQSARDVVKQLKRIDETPDVNVSPAVSANRGRWILGTIAAVATIVAAILGIRLATHTEPVAPMVRFEVLPPGDGIFTGNPPRFAVSPNGKYLVFAANDEQGKPDRLWIRRMDSSEVKPIPGTESVAGALLPQFPFWSPDSTSIAFFVQSKVIATEGSRLRRVDIQGGTVQTLCELPSNNAGGTWNSEGIILVSSQGSNGIQRIPANGGVPVQVTALDKSRNEVAHLFPQFLPDGRHFIYQSQTPSRNERAFYLGSLDSSERRKLVQSDYARFAAPASLLYVRGDSLYAQNLDVRKLELSGEPVLVANFLFSLAGNGRAGFSVSDSGTLVYANNPLQQGSSANRQLVWLDRSGKADKVAGEPASSVVLRLAADGKRVTLPESGGGEAPIRDAPIWIYDFERGVRTLLTSGTPGGFSPVWSSDGSKLFFAARREGKLAIYEKPANGATPEVMLWMRDDALDLGSLPLDASTDGKTLLVSMGIGQGLRNIMVIPLKGERKAVPYAPSSYDQPQAALSPNGKWLAYVSLDSGIYQVIVQPFPEPSAGRHQVSISGGTSPRWRRDGKELYYIDSERRLTAVSLSGDRELLQIGKSIPLFTTPALAGLNIAGSSYPYDVSADGQRFLLSVPVGADSAKSLPLTVTVNWQSALKP